MQRFRRFRIRLCAEQAILFGLAAASTTALPATQDQEDHPIDPGGEGSDEGDVDFCNPEKATTSGGLFLASSGDPEDNPCVILFLDGWALDTGLKFALGCLGCAALGLFLEQSDWLRRYLDKRHAIFGNRRGPARCAAAATAYWLGCAATALAAVAVAATLCVELLLAVTLGAAAGHVAFNLDRRPYSEFSRPLPPPPSPPPPPPPSGTDEPAAAAADDIDEKQGDSDCQEDENRN